MDAKPPLRKALELEPLDFPAPAGDAERKESDASAHDGQAERDPRIQTGDEFLARAEKEYQEGRIDPALWRLAAAQGANDESVVIAAYLRARATVLKLQQKRATVPPAAGPTARPTAGAGERKVVSAPPAEVDSANQAGTRRRGMQPRLKYLAAAGAAALAVVAVVVWLYPSESGSVRQPVVSAAPSSPNQTASPAPPGSVQGDTAGASQRDLRPAYETEIRDLKQAGTGTWSSSTRRTGRERSRTTRRHGTS